MLILDFCTEPEVLKVILFVLTLLNMLFFIVPIGLIVMISVDFLKNVIAANLDDMSKNLKIVIKRITYCVVLFLVPSIVSFVIDLSTSSISSLNVDYESCLKNTEYIEYYEKLSALKEAEKKEKEQNKTKRKATKEKVETVILFSSNDGNSGGKSGKLTLDWTDVTKISNVSAADLKRSLETSKTFSGKGARFAPYATTYVSLEKKNSVNLFLVMAINAWESGWLDSNATKQCSNIAGVKYVGQPGAVKCITTSEGDNYAGWPSIDKFLNYYVPWLKKEYLTEGGAFYNGKTPEGIVIKYTAGSKTWVAGVKSIGDGLFSQVKNTVEG